MNDLIQLLTDPENQPHQFVGRPNDLIGELAELGHLSLIPEGLPDIEILKTALMNAGQPSYEERQGEYVQEIAQTIKSILDGTAPMSKWEKHTGVKTLDDLEWYLKSQLKQCLTLQAAKSIEGEDMTDWALGKQHAYKSCLANLQTAKETTLSQQAAEISERDKRIAELEEGLRFYANFECLVGTMEGSTFAIHDDGEQAAKALKGGSHD